MNLSVPAALPPAASPASRRIASRMTLPVAALLGLCAATNTLAQTAPPPAPAAAPAEPSAAPEPASGAPAAPAPAPAAHAPAPAASAPTPAPAVPAAASEQASGAPAAPVAPAASAPAATPSAAASAPATPATPAAAPATTSGTGPDTSGPAKQENGIWYTAEGNPTYKMAEDGTLDYATFAGYIRYTAECMQCHGPDGMGSTYAPPLKDVVMRISYSDFTGIVAGGMQDVSAAQTLVMPAFGNNNNVMCYLDDIYAYLLARGEGKLDRGRPQKKEPKSDAFKAAENECMG